MTESGENAHYDLIGVGLYTIPEASKLSGVSTSRIRRWISGYTYRHPGDEVSHSMPPVWKSDLPEIDGKLALTFLDLMEVRFVNAFLEDGVSWRTLRRVVEEARKMLDTNHPFASRRFVTDGQTIFAEIGRRTHRPKLLDLSRNQFTFRQVVSPSLTSGLEFASNNRLVVRWWPLGSKRKIVVLDPQRSFGRPIVHDGSVPTAVLAAAVKAEGEENGAVERVAKWYGIEARAVSTAVEYEQQLAA